MRPYRGSSIISIKHHTYTSAASRPAGSCNIGYPSETHIKEKSRENSFFRDIRYIGPIGWTIWTEHGGDTAVLSVKFKNDWVIETNEV